MVDYNYKINIDHKIVVCIMTVSDEYSKEQISAVAKCAPDDTFSIEKGKAIAKRKVLIKWKRHCMRTYKDYIQDYNCDIRNIEERKAVLENRLTKMRKTIGRLMMEIDQIDQK